MKPITTEQYNRLINFLLKVSNETQNVDLDDGVFGTFSEPTPEAKEAVELLKILK